MLISILVLSAFAATPFVVLATRVRGAAATAILPAALFTGFATLLPDVLSGNVIVERYPWIPSLGVFLSFRADGLSLLFALLITGIGTCVFLYAASYLGNRADRPAFFAYLTLFMGAMLGVVLAENLICLLVFWELTSLTSFLLIGFEHEKPQAIRNAQQGLLVTVGGGLALMAGFVLLGSAAGSYQLSDILSQGPALTNHHSTVAVIGLIAFGAFTKSAQTPFHFWLPNAMVAPTPVSAYLHSATMVKLGVYLLARLNPLFEEHELWITLLLTVGSATMLTGAFLALRETDLKRVLAYSTLVALGMLVSLIGLPHKLAAMAMAMFLIVHALYKACLFLVAGIIDHEAGTRNIVELGGLRRTMPVTAAIAVLGALSMAGLPPFMGFIGKELVYEAGLIAPVPWLAAAIAVTANAVTVAAAAIVVVRCFFGAVTSTPKASHDPAVAMLIGPGVLALLGLAFGAAPWFIEDLVGQVAEATTGRGVTAHLALWHGLTTMLVLSLVTLAVGILVFMWWDRLRGWLRSFDEIDRFGPNAAYDRLMVGLVHVATWQTQLIQSGRLHTYVSAFFMTVTVGVAAGLFLFNGFSLPKFSGANIQPIMVLPVLLILASFAVLGAASFMAGIVAAGIIGFLMSLVYLFQGAPDLAFTQFSVEVISIVVLLTIVGRMPFHETDYRSSAERRRDSLLSICLGTVAALVLLAVIAAPFDNRLSEYYKQASVAEAHGHNIVNVIIVDFRAIDTLGEITVLTLAAIAASAVIATAPLSKWLTRAVVKTQGASMNSLILQVSSRLIFPVALGFSVYLLWRGHNEPGGGFVGGLVAAAGFIVYALPRGRASLMRLILIRPESIAGSGVLLALCSGLSSLTANQPFLTHKWITLSSGLAIGTPLAFDFGVYLAVVGAVLTFLSYYLEL